MLRREGLGIPLLVLAGILLAAVGAGSLWDLPLAELIYAGGNSVFGSIFSAFGELPAYFMLYSAGIILWVHRGKRSRFQDVFLLLGSISLILLGFLGEFCECRESLPQLGFVPAAVILLMLFAAQTCLTLLLLRSACKEDALRFVMMVLCVCVTSMLLANLAKIPWARPRMSFLAEEPSARFVPWYRPGDGQKAEFMAQGAAADSFRSFPSGHVTTAAASLLWLLFPTMHQFFEGKGRLLLSFSAVWTAVVAVSRMTLGAHFLSDTSLSWLVVLGLFVLFLPLVYSQSPVYRLLRWILS